MVESLKDICDRCVIFFFVGWVESSYLDRCVLDIGYVFRVVVSYYRGVS